MQRNRTKSWSGFAGGLVVSLGFASAALAEDSGTAGVSSAGDATITLPEMSVSAQADKALFAPDTASQGVVTGEQIQQQPVYRVGETLEVVPGLIVTQHSGEGKANQYFLRGFNLDHGTDIDISLDDMPVNLRTHAHGQGYADLNFMIPELISTLQYGKGPYFPALGDFDTAGAVQIICRHPAARPRLTERRHVRLRPWARRGLASGGSRQPSGCGRIRSRRRAMDDPGQLQQGKPRGQL